MKSPRVAFHERSPGHRQSERLHDTALGFAPKPPGGGRALPVSHSPAAARRTPRVSAEVGVAGIGQDGMGRGAFRGLLLQFVRTLCFICHTEPVRLTERL